MPYTHISIILDRTGSMEDIRNDVIGGFNAFLKAQLKEKGKATLTLVQFDSQNPYEVVHYMKRIHEIPKLSRKTFVPRASTPLLDAIGRGINDLEQRLVNVKPDQIIMVIITDGQENSSIEFNKAQISKMIKEKREKDKWQFVFLSADLDSIDDARQYGFAAGSSMAYDRTAGSVNSSFDSLSQRITDFWNKRTNDVFFTDTDRAQHQNEKKKAVQYRRPSSFFLHPVTRIVKVFFRDFGYDAL